MKRIALTAIVCVMAVVNIASAELIRGIDIDFVTIGNAGNPGDTRTDYPDSADPYGCGAVGYEYQIGMYEVTNGQWDAFVSAAGAPAGNPSNAYDYSAFWTGDDIPTNVVSWYEAAQFCNYLTSGEKSQGAYLFSGNNTNPGNYLGIDRGSAISAYDIAYVIPTEDEWYKAAYYTGSGYSTYANGTDVSPIAGDDTNYNSAVVRPWAVGTGTIEQNGTFDMMGNVWEWNETLISGSSRGIRGGTYDSYNDWLSSSYRVPFGPEGQGDFIGFRVASVPEPSTFLLLSLGAVMLRKRIRL
jgi:formylglycine-generating enzyme required for sulfatase activity